MATNRLVQRLIAAGATPARAQAFANQFIASQPAGAKPQDIQDAFDQQLFDLSYSLYPSTFKVPRAGDPLFVDYANFVLTPARVAQIEQKAIATNAPNFNAALKGTGYESLLAKAVQAGASPTQIKTRILTDFENELPALLAFPVTTTDGDQVSAASSLVDTLFKEFADLDIKKIETLQKELDKNKNYQFGLPEPTLKYGSKTDLKLGIIDFRTHPSVARILETDGKRAEQIAKTAPARYIGESGGGEAFNKMRNDAMNFTQNLLDKLVVTKATPFVDEIKRREFLKKKKIK